MLKSLALASNLALSCGSLFAAASPIEIQPIGLMPGETFGNRLAASTHACAVSSSTSIYVFQNQDGRWAQSARIPLAAELNDETARLGPVPAFDPQRMIIGLRWDSTVAKHNGAALALSLRDGEWTNRRMLHPPVEDVKLLFGDSVSLDGGTCAVGAPGYSGTLSFGGCVYLLQEAADGSWGIHARLEAPTIRAEERLGEHVALFGDWCVATGCRIDSDTKANKPGPTYIFHRANGTWSFHSQFVPAQATGFGFFYFYPVAMWNDRIVIGGHRMGRGCEAYVVRLQDGAWIEETKLEHLPIDQRSFGGSVAIHDDLLAVGAPPNAVYWYRKSGDTWVMKERLPAVKAGVDAQQFGSTVAISDECLLVGAPNSNKPVDGGGSLYVYKLDGDSGK